MFRHILVATGQSPWSRHAVETAVRLASEWQSDLLIVHILEDDPQYQPPGAGALSDTDLSAELETSGAQILAQASEQAVQAQVPHETVLHWGSIPEQIVQQADAHQCDLIVMGTRHLTGDKRLMTGRICNAVIATAPCPVLVVPLVQGSL